MVKRKSLVGCREDVLKVLIVSDGVITFKGVSPLNRPEKVEELLKLLELKGLCLPKKNKGWW